MEPKTQKALKAVTDALQHLSSVQDIAFLEFNHIDQLLARLIDLPTESKQKNSRRNLQLIRQWMREDGSGIVLLEVLGGVYWRLGDLNEEQFRVLRELLYKEHTYVEVLRGQRAADIILQRIRYVQEKKYQACEEFIESLKTSDVKFAFFRKQIFDTPSPERIATPDTMMYQVDDAALLTPPPENESLRFMSYQHLAQNDIEQELINNYVYTICPSRTLLTVSNPYFRLLEYAEKHESTRCAVLSLSASYMKSAALDNQKYYDADQYYIEAALRALMQDLTNPTSSEACLLAGMLLIHHSIVNEAEIGACWSCHFNILNIFSDSRLLINSDAAVFMSHQMILTQTIQSRMQIQSTGCKSMNWLMNCQIEESTRLSGATGISRRLSYLIYRVTTAVTSKEAKRNDLSYLEELQNALEYTITPWTTEVTGEALQVALDTAETYRLAALIYLHCRCFGLTPFHPTIVQLHQELYTRLLSLPVSGPLFTSGYPIWPFFIASVTGSSALRKSLYDRFPRPKRQDRGTFMSTLQAIGTCQLYFQGEKSKAQKRKDWWEEMVNGLSGRDTMLCLGIAM